MGDSNNNVGWAGLGAMGAGMASNLAASLAEQGSQLVVYNRTAAKAAAFAESRQGVTRVDTPGALASRCVVTFCSLANDAGLEEVFSQYLSGLPPDATKTTIFVDTSTVLPSTTARLAAAAAERGVVYCTCPVFGRPDAALAGNLMAALAGGSEAVHALVKPLVQAFARRGVWDLGDKPTAANAFKLTGNMAIAGQIELAAECLALADKAGLPQGPVLELLTGIAQNGIAAGYAERIAGGKYESSGGFTVELGLKDVGHMRTLGRELSCPVPLADLAHNHLLTAKARHGAHLDWGALALAVRDAAGLPPNLPASAGAAERG